MRVLITGGHGKVGSVAAKRLYDAGHRVTLTDLGPADYGPQPAGRLPYIRADLVDYGATIATVQRCRPDVVVHSAGIPEPSHDPPHTIFANNAVGTFNVAEAISRSGVARLIYISSETAPGYVTAEHPVLPDYLPVDEEHPLRPQDGYALSKAVGEHICDALVRRSEATAVSIRPSLVLAGDDYQNIIPGLQKRGAVPSFNFWSYVDADDLAELIGLAVEWDSVEHEVIYGAQPDNFMGASLDELVASAYGKNAPPLRPLARPDAGGISISKAQRLLGWKPAHSWRDRLES